MRRLATLLVWLLISATAASAQTATLVADRLFIAGDNRLVAEGNVEILFGGAHLRAARLEYDQASNRLVITGPIVLTDGDSVIFMADAAELADDLRNGILISARLVLDRQLQLAAARIDRIGGRYTQLTNAVASSCEICASNPVPVWEIRARRVVHDQRERQLYFDRAVMRVGGVPVFYIPRLRLPDPTLKRANGFLVPSVGTNSLLGFGIKTPYFIMLGDHADVTLTPYLSPNTRTLEYRLRHETALGRYDVEGALTRDDLVANDRYYLLASGEFALPRDYRLQFRAALVSDAAYLADYGYSDMDRLETGLAMSRARAQGLIRADLSSFETLRAAEIPIADTLPRLSGTLSTERRFALPVGQVRAGAEAALIHRDATTPADGRDVESVTLWSDWAGGATTAGGLRARAEAGVAGAVYAVQQDPAFAPLSSALAAHAALTLRWPLERSQPGGGRTLLEPVAQIVWSGARGDAFPNEDSSIVELDPGNLFAIDRLAGLDAMETGLRANLGVALSHSTPAGHTLGLALGRVVRASDPGQFSPGSGLDGLASDWVTALQLDLGQGLQLANQTLLSDTLTVTKSTTLLSAVAGRATLAGSHLFLLPDPAENRPDTTSELSVEAGYRLARHWTGRVDSRYDLVNRRAAESGLRFEYRSECLTLDLSLSRRFASSTSVAPSTAFGLQVSLAGIGGGGGKDAPRRQCRG